MTVATTANPGNVIHHQLPWIMTSCALARVEPHESLGGLRPKPRKLTNASSTMLLAMPNVNATTIGPTALGNRCRKMMRPGEAPTVLLLTLNVFLLLTAYYLLKVAREPLILLGSGAEVKSYASVGQSILLIFVASFYGWLSGRVGRMVLITGSNQGIGLECGKGPCFQRDLHVCVIASGCDT